jgi:hypothetical protein
MTDEPGTAPAPRAPIAAVSAPSKPRRQVRRHVKPRAPFLPAEPHPHGWLTKHQLRPHLAAPSLLTEKK